ncbi:MAG: Maf family nucleotide pyrophosphatase [Burkholderiales bacterium]
MEQKTGSPLVLASTSVYRRTLLARLMIPFTVFSPQVDESPALGEAAAATAARLALLKAQAAAQSFRAHLVVGSDQVAECDGVRMDKPLAHEVAVRQLRLLSGHSAVFHTAVTLLESASGRVQTEVVATRVRFRKVDDAQIERYLRKEPAYDCAGSAKSEGLGIALIEAMETTDPTALVGLPLIALSRMLRNEGVEVP